MAGARKARSARTPKATATRTRRARRPAITMVQRSRLVPPSEKAAYHVEAGAGRGQVIRDFLGLNADDERVILERFDKALEAAVRG